ncbi:MAG: hypothetical protein C0613_06385 [Desulfobulbaceae bacterium]|nr:MAG: hypothetical protein C0613_06385 [Desulfobulbaceae bacterium]
MISKKEEKKLREILNRAAEPDQALSYDALRGFLFGLAMTPDVVVPSEWLPVAFGDEMFAVDTEQEAQQAYNVLMQVYNKFIDLFQGGRLTCPPDLVGLDQDGDFAVVEEWAYGLTEALLLREEFWYAEEGLELEGLTPEEEGLHTAMTVVQAMAMPDEAAEVLDSPPDKEEGDFEQLLASLSAIFPDAVDFLVGYASVLEAERQRILAEAGSGIPGPPRPVQSEKVGRNEPCPCGSGKKYKKCCLQQAKVVPIH